MTASFPWMILTALACTFARAAPAPDDAARTALTEALRRLGEAPTVAWRTALVTSGSRNFGLSITVSGIRQRDGYTRLAFDASGESIDLVTKDAKTAVRLDGIWQTLEQAAARANGGRRGFLFGDRGALAASRIPYYAVPWADALERLASGDVVKEGDVYTVKLPAGAIADILLGRSRPPSADEDAKRPRGTGFEDPQGAFTITVQAGRPTRLVLAARGVRRSGTNSSQIERTVTTTFSDAGSPQVEVPVDAKEIVEALMDGRAPDVFVPEPGFERLFNGRDLAGWSAQGGTWSVEEGAIVGRAPTTSATPAAALLVAQRGAGARPFDDFELRFAFRVDEPDGQRGATGSGVRFRASADGKSDAATYRADLAGVLVRTSGGGGSGRTEVLALPGERVVWKADGARDASSRIAPPAVSSPPKKGDWNECTIVTRGSRIQLAINGADPADAFIEAESLRPSSGALALEAPSATGAVVRYKNLRVKSLSSAAESAASNLKAPKDFKVELLYSVPREQQGSWVVLCVDPKGRLIAGDQNGKLYRMAVPPPGSAGAVDPEPIALDVGGAHGLLWAFDSLYVVVNERGTHGLYRLRDTDGDDRLDDVKLLRELQAGGEHGAHSIVLSPDGKSLYLIVGNQSTLTRTDASRVPFAWSEDNLIPRIPTGFMDGSMAPQGWIARTDPDGKQWELIATGMRNPFDLAFNREGELFTYDADMEWDIGAPWYRPTRILHAISGAEFGFRNGSGKWPDYFLDSFGSAADVGPGSPTGISFGYGAKFPARYQDALFICDWSFGKLRAVHLTPDGASYAGNVEEFVSGQPLPLTDVIIHPLDGAMYFTVGGRGAQSALYRVTYTGAEPTGAGAPDARLQDRRDIRHRLEAFHGRQDPGAVAALWPFLSDADRSIRNAARVALEWQDVGAWRERALSEREPRKAIPALAALARMSRKDDIHRKEADAKPDPALRGRVLAALNAIELKSLPPSDLLDLLRAYELAFTRLGPPGDTELTALSPRLASVLPSANRDVNIQTANLLVYLQSAEAAPRILGLLREAPTQEEQIEYVLALRALRAGWTPPLREEYFRWFVTKGASYRGGNTFASSIETIRKEAAATLSDAERSQLKGLLEAPPERRSPGEILAARPVVKAWTLEELIPIVGQGLQGGRNFARGRKLYSDAGCAACHRLSTDGGSVGPDLTGLAGRFSVHDVLEAIVDPNKVISDQYAAIVIHKKTGEIVTGRIANLGASNIDVVENMLEPGRMTSLRREDIEAMEESKVSMMPEGLLNSLTPPEIQDLAAFLLSRGDSNAPAFR